MIKTIVLDDEWYNLEEVCALVEKTGFMKIEGKYMNPLKALEEVASLHPQVAFIDIEMPELDGLTFAERLLEINPGVMVAFITSWNQYAVQAFELNALDYVMKPIKEERFQKLVEKIRTEISRNERSSYAERVLSLYEKQDDFTSEQPSIHLTERETQVLTLLSQGLTQREIAERLYLSVSSIKKHLESIYTKFCVNNKISAVQKAREAKIL
ncbi:MAG: two component transcriptional regulator, LuxR family [Eubacterium sp.]|jgi:DNA-binding NarL/FixJ family response regulator|nr:two component transcriptional regulator, LuxR family [Eubacterium sp.]